MQKSLISIIVPCYNQAQYLDECLRSVLDQTYENWECIIVDDGSPDNTEEVAKKWVEQDARFQIFKKENGGVASARNFGIEKAKGEWILPLDGDDKIGKKYLEFAAAQFENKYDLIYCKAEFFGEMFGRWNLPNYSYDDLLVSNHIFCSSFFKKGLWQESSGYNSFFIYGMEDWDFWLSILNRESKVFRIDYVGFYYRRKIESRDTLYNDSKYKKLISERQIYNKHLDKYLIYDENPLINFKIQQLKNQKLQNLNLEIKKNWFTKLLYKIIEKL